MARIELPKDHDWMVDALDAMLGPAEHEANLNLVAHRIIDGYLQGIRKFMVLDRWAGEVSFAIEDVKGDLNLRYEEILNKWNVEMGRWLKSDLGPMPSKLGEGLDDMRKAAVALAILSSRVAKLPMDRLKIQMLTPFLMYGTVGLAHYETGNPDSPDLIEVVPARQLRGLPAMVSGLEGLVGIARKRWVPFEWLAARAKKVWNKDISRHDIVSDLMGQEVQWGGTVPDQPDWDAAGGGGSSSNMVLTSAVTPKDQLNLELMEFRNNKRRPDAKNRHGQWYVPLEEIHLYDDTQQYTAHFVMKVGRKIITEDRFEQRNVRAACPLQIARHTDTGRFFGRGFVAPLIPINDQIEKMLQALFRNVKELDMFGTVLFSGGMGVDLKRWRTGPRPKADKYEIDPLSPNAQPMRLEPVNSGPLPGQIAQMGMGLMDKLSGQGPHFSGEAAGRVDSAAGLGFLFNTGNTGLGLASNNLANALSGIYSRMLQVAKERRAESPIPLVLLDDALAGVVIDPQSGQLSLDTNPVPWPWEVRLDIRDRTPKDKDIRKQELKELYTQGLLGQDDTRFWIAAYEEGLDLPGSPKDLIETWRKALWQIILLFGNGTEPGPRITDQHSQNPGIQLMAVQRFMNKIEFSLAAPAVQDEFFKWKQELEVMSGQAYPMGLPPPEDVASMQAQMTGMPGAGGPAQPAPAQMGSGADSLAALAMGGMA